MEHGQSHVLVCTGAGCIASGALELSAAFNKAIAEHHLADTVKVIETGCLGPCAVGPVVVIYPDGTFYERLKPADAEEIVSEHLLKGRLVDRLVRTDASTATAVPTLDQIDFFKRQERIVLRNCGVIDPQKIEEYIARDGYMALAKVLFEMTPEQVVETITKSGLRGRGGAGFPTGLKWKACREAKSDVKYVLCNADEGDPGAFMDRSVLEGDPHCVIEAMIIAGYTIGARQGYVYVRAEYPLAVQRLQKAIEQARERGLLGKDILGSKHSFDLEIRMGSGAFVCGEETALMTSIEGNRGEPRPRPPFPASKGLWGKPSLLNNVETYASIAPIILRGWEWYAKLGTEKSKGTKVFALAGAVNNTGLVEVPIGMPLGDIVYDIGGGIPRGKGYKAAQVGGPSGGCIPKEHLNVPMDYDTLQELGAIMGSGGLIIMDDDACMVDVARFFLEFIQDESCGKCPPCRVGTKRMLEIVERICEGKGEEGDVETLMELGQTIRDTSLCGLGQSAPNPVLSTIRHFREEYDAHIREKRCPAGVCAALVRAPCQNACPAGVDVPGYVSLIKEHRYDEALRLHRERNPLAAICSRVCFHPCESKCRRAGLDESLSIRGLKRVMVDHEEGFLLPEMRSNPANADRKVAVIGAGPTGLTAAYFLCRLGYRPTIFEAERKPGGMLMQGIPEYRLPRSLIAHEVEMIERLGATIQYGKRLGRDFTLEGLKQTGYEAVFLGVGAPKGMRLGVPGEDAAGVEDSISYLRAYNLTGKAPAGKRVAVIGGGNAAVDVARTTLRLGAEHVDVYYRRTREQMPAWVEEVQEAEREGVQFHFLVAPKEIMVEKGHAKGVRFQPQGLGQFDKSGRRKAVDAKHKELQVEADLVVAAIGQALDKEALFNGLTLELDKGGWLKVNRLTGQASVPWIFSGGDAILGPSSVAAAVGTGQRAAAGIDNFLTGARHDFWNVDKPVDVAFDPDADPVEYPRAEMKLLAVAKRRGNFTEVESTYTGRVATREAERCLRCDYREACGE